MTRIRPPCSPDCPDRCAEPNCHMTCGKYLKYTEEHAKELEQIRAYKETKHCLDTFQLDINKRNRAFSNEKYLKKKKG